MEKVNGLEVKGFRETMDKGKGFGVLGLEQGHCRAIHPLSINTLSDPLPLFFFGSGDCMSPWLAPILWDFMMHGGFAKQGGA